MAKAKFVLSPADKLSILIATIALISTFFTIYIQFFYRTTNLQVGSISIAQAQDSLSKSLDIDVLFLNSGDWLNNPDVLSNFVGMNPREDFVYGDSIFVHPDKPAYKKTMPDELKGVVIFERTLNHQSVFHKSTLFINFCVVF